MARTVGSRAPKAKAWEKLGSFMMDRGSKRLLEIMKDMDDDEYVALYLKLAQYFKPKMQATTLKSEGSVNIQVVSDDKDLMDKV